MSKKANLKKSGKLKVGVIGYGKMGLSLVKGALKSGTLSKEHVIIYDSDEKRSSLAREEGLKTADSLSEFASCRVIILAVKPKDIPLLLEDLKNIIKKTPDPKPLVVSIAAGVRLSYLAATLGEDSRLARVMPNIAASVNESVSVVVPNNKTTEEDLKLIKSTLEGVGLVFMLTDESLLDVVTGISGSGPAYFFFLMKVMEEVGRKYGLDEKLVRIIIAQTCKGAGEMALISKEPLEQLISAVASPGGTTEEALKIMNSRGFQTIISDAISAAIEKSKKMAYS